MTEQERLEDEMVVEALRSVGVHVTSTQDLMRTREPYPAAIEVLVEKLGQVKTYMLKEIITRSLTTKEAKGKAEAALIAEFELSLHDGCVEANAFRWAIGNALETLGGTGNADAYMRLLQDPRGSGAYDMLILAAAKTKDKRFIPLFLEHLAPEKLLQGFAARGLGVLKAEEAIPKLKALAAKTKNSWARREALTALRRMGVDAAIPKAGEKKSAKSKSEGSGRGSGKAGNQERESAEVSSSGPLAERLSALAECGIRLSPTVTPALLASRISPERPEKDSY